MLIATVGLLAPGVKSTTFAAVASSRVSSGPDTYSTTTEFTFNAPGRVACKKMACVDVWAPAGGRPSVLGVTPSSAADSNAGDAVARKPAAKQALQNARSGLESMGSRGNRRATAAWRGWKD